MSGEPIYLEADDPTVRMLARAVGYSGRKFKAELTTRVNITGVGWSGGSKNDFFFVRLADGLVMPAPHAPGAELAFALESHAPSYYADIPLGIAVVKHARLEGKDLGLTFYIRPENAGRLLPAPVELTHTEHDVLGYLIAVIPKARPTRASFWEPTIEKLRQRGFVDGRGAITVAGKNAYSSVRADALPPYTPEEIALDKQPSGRSREFLLASVDDLLGRAARAGKQMDRAVEIVVKHYLLDPQTANMLRAKYAGQSPGQSSTPPVPPAPSATEKPMPRPTPPVNTSKLVDLFMIAAEFTEGVIAEEDVESELARVTGEPLMRESPIDALSDAVEREGGNFDEFVGWVNIVMEEGDEVTREGVELNLKDFLSAEGPSAVPPPPPPRPAAPPPPPPPSGRSSRSSYDDDTPKTPPSYAVLDERYIRPLPRKMSHDEAVEFLAKRQIRYLPDIDPVRLVTTLFNYWESMDAHVRSEVQRIMGDGMARTSYFNLGDVVYPQSWGRGDTPHVACVVGAYGRNHRRQPCAVIVVRDVNAAPGTLGVAEPLAMLRKTPRSERIAAMAPPRPSPAREYVAAAIRAISTPAPTPRPASAEVEHMRQVFGAATAKREERVVAPVAAPPPPPPAPTPVAAPSSESLTVSVQSVTNSAGKESLIVEQTMLAREGGMWVLKMPAKFGGSVVTTSNLAKHAIRSNRIRLEFSPPLVGDIKYVTLMLFGRTNAAFDGPTYT